MARGRRPPTHGSLPVATTVPQLHTDRLPSVPTPAASSQAVSLVSTSEHAVTLATQAYLRSRRGFPSQSLTRARLVQLIFPARKATRGPSEAAAWAQTSNPSPLGRRGRGRATLKRG